MLSAEFAGLSGPDPELLRVVLAPPHGRVRAELERFGGTAGRLAGGAVLAVFGAPVAHEDDPDRAVRAGLRVLEVAGQFGHDSPQLEPVVRIGVATGEALVSFGTGPPEGASLAQGHVVTVAVGLQRAADAGTVVVDEITMSATRRTIEYEALEACLLEGEPQARPAWAARRARPQALAKTALTPFVGRQHELALLATVRASVAEEQLPRLAAIVGEAGIGKTRLADELIRRMEFAWPSPVFGGRLGAFHGLEIPFVFGNLSKDAPIFGPLLGDDPPQELAAAIHAAWIAFAATGNPGWPPYDLACRATMRFNTTSQVIDDPRSWERALWQGIR